MTTPETDRKGAVSALGRIAQLLQEKGLLEQAKMALESKIAGSVSSSTLVKIEPLRFGCDICTTLRFETLAEADVHCRTENRTIRSVQWRHEPTVGRGDRFVKVVRK